MCVYIYQYIPCARSLSLSATWSIHRCIACLCAAHVILHFSLFLPLSLSHSLTLSLVLSLYLSQT